jgi:RNA recognition motif-containing protein
MNNEQRFINDQKIMSEKRKVYIGNLDLSYTRQEMYNYFAQYADIEEVILIKRNEKEQFSFITFKTPMAGDIVCSQKHRIKPDGELLVCEIAKMEQAKQKKDPGVVVVKTSLRSTVMLEDTKKKSLFYESDEQMLQPVERDQHSWQEKAESCKAEDEY